MDRCPPTRAGARERHETSQPHSHPSAEHDLSGRPSGCGARLAAALGVRQGHPESELQPRRGPDGVPGRRRGWEHRLRGGTRTPARGDEAIRFLDCEHDRLRWRRIGPARTTPADQTTFPRTILGQPWGSFVRHGMAVLGVDGAQATNGVGTPAAGHISVKDGSRLATTPNDYQGIITAKTQEGYIDAKSGRQLVYAVFLGTAPYATFDDFVMADHDVAAIAAAFREGY